MKTIASLLVLLTENANRPVDPVLLSWVPRPLVEFVDEAIRVNIEDCIYWYEGV